MTALGWRGSDSHRVFLLRVPTVLPRYGRGGPLIDRVTSEVLGAGVVAASLCVGDGLRHGRVAWLCGR
jgi:hypothetical protein